MDIFIKKQKPVDYGAIETIVGASTKIKGEINSEGPIRVNGKVDGKIIAGKDVFIDENSKIKGDVTGERVIVAGEINGNVTGFAGVEIEKSGIIHGDLIGDKLLIEEGATYKGKVYIGNKAKEKHKSVAGSGTIEVKTPSTKTTEVYQLFQQSDN